MSPSEPGRADSHRRLIAAAIVVLYLLLVFLPLVVALAPPRPSGRAFWLEFSLACGFVGLGQLAMQFALIARFQRISRPFGIDLVMQYHRHLGVMATAMVLVHPALLVWDRWIGWDLLMPGGGGGANDAGVFSTIALVLLVILSFWRRPFGLTYEAWRVSHALLGIITLVLAQIHVSLAGLYIDAAWQHVVLAFWCAVVVSLVAYLRLIKPLQLARRPWTVVEVRPDVADCWTLTLAPVGHAGVRFAAGQFAWLKIGVSPRSVREHPFSFCSSAESPRQIQFGIKELGDFTSTIGRIGPGTRVFLDGPHGSFTPELHVTPGFVFIAGGIGISPILSMLRTLADRGDRQPHALIYACSRWERVAFRAEVEALLDRLELDLVYVLEEADEDWLGPRGTIDASVLAEVLGDDVARRQVFVCGPDAMMNAVEALLRKAGVPAHRITMERFNLV